MSWITRCPDCNTVYKVESEQLQQAHGWLRCGACQHVFDSTGRVVAADVIPTLNERVNVGAPQLGRVDLDRLLHKESPPPVAPLPGEPTQVQPQAPVSAEPSAVTAFEDALQSFKLPDPPAAATAVEDAQEQESAPADSAAPVASPARTPSRAAQGALLLLVLLLALQALLAARPVLVMHWPQAARLLSQWCETAACRAQWQPPLSWWTLQVQAEGAHDNGHRLSWSLRHSATEPLPLPDLALTLLDAQGQSVSSQRLSAAMTSAPDTLGAGQIWQGALPLDLAGHAQASQAQLRLLPR